MSTLFEEAVLKARKLSDDEQDELAAALFAQMSGQQAGRRLTPEQLEAVRATARSTAHAIDDLGAS